MAFPATNTSALSQGLASGDWQDNVALNNDSGELYDSFFQGDANYSEPTGEESQVPLTNLQALGDLPPPHLYSPADATFNIEDPPSDYITSAPPSVVGGPSSFDQPHPWLTGSPSFTTSAISPLLHKDELIFTGSFGQAALEDCADGFTQLRTSTLSPFLDTHSFASSNSYHTAAASVFDGQFEASPTAPNSYDISSQTLSNLGGWVDPAIDADPEYQPVGTTPIPIPHSGAQVFSNTFSSHPWSGDFQLQRTRPRAQTIPQPDHAPGNLQTQWHRRTSSRSSASPDAKRLPRSVPLARSLSNISKGDPRRAKAKLAAASPIPNTWGWVSYQPNSQTNRLVPSGADCGTGRRQKGRTGALTPEQRRHAAMMRKNVSCSNCRRRKEKCDPGIPCKSCLDHYKSDLVHHPCRDRRLANLTGTFLSERVGWHPTARALNSFFPSENYHISTFTYRIPLYFGFGPSLQLPVHSIETRDPIIHEHIVYAWPPSASSKEVHRHAVLPAVLTSAAASVLQKTLDDHLSMLVRHQFRSFPLFCSQLYILRDLYVFYRSLPTDSHYSQLLHQALKLFVLVHVGGDITLPPPSTDLTLGRLVNNTMNMPENSIPTPCFIRAQFGSVMPTLAMDLMNEVLSSLELLFLNRSPHEWPAALAALIIVLMTVESIQYHDAKLPYHNMFDTGVPLANQEIENKIDDEGVDSLLKFYSACFLGCHARLGADWQGDSGTGATPEDKFVMSVREAVRKAKEGGYLEAKAQAERVGDDMSFFFDRLASRLLVLNI